MRGVKKQQQTSKQKKQPTDHKNISNTFQQMFQKNHIKQDEQDIT